MDYRFFPKNRPSPKAQIHHTPHFNWVPHGFVQYTAWLLRVFPSPIRLVTPGLSALSPPPACNISSSQCQRESVAHLFAHCEFFPQLKCQLPLPGQPDPAAPLELPFPLWSGKGSPLWTFFLSAYDPPKTPPKGSPVPRLLAGKPIPQGLDRFPVSTDTRLFSF